jgi:hypothetical protein
VFEELARGHHRYYSAVFGFPGIPANIHCGEFRQGTE